MSHGATVLPPSNLRPLPATKSTLGSAFTPTTYLLRVELLRPRLMAGPLSRATASIQAARRRTSIDVTGGKVTTGAAALQDIQIGQPPTPSTTSSALLRAGASFAWLATTVPRPAGTPLAASAVGVLATA